MPGSQPANHDDGESDAGPPHPRCKGTYWSHQRQVKALRLPPNSMSNMKKAPHTQKHFDSQGQAASHLAPQLGLTFMQCERVLRRVKKMGAPGFRSNRVYPALLLPWLTQHLRAAELKLLAAGGDKESALRCRRLQIQCERGEYALAAERELWIPKSEVQAWLVSARAKVKAVLVQKLRNELPPRLEGLRASDIADRMDNFIEEIVDCLRGQFSA
ncbi:MAG: hypothetical protein ACYDH9_09660 [Limisphaerales bacterium]